MPVLLTTVFSGTVCLLTIIARDWPRRRIQGEISTTGFGASGHTRG